MVFSSRAVAVVAAFAAAGAAHAGGDMLVSTVSPSPFSIYKTANFANGSATNLAQKFTIDGTYEIDTISFFGQGTDIDFYIVDSLDPSGSDADAIRWAIEGYEASGGRSWRDHAGGGLILGPGEYFAVMASDSSTGARWSQAWLTDPAQNLNIGDDGEGTYPKGNVAKQISTIDYVFSPGDDFSLALRISGTEAVPTPGTLAIAGVGGLVALRRRRR